MRRNRTYIIRWDMKHALFRLDSFERRFGHGISDERMRLMPYFSLHVHDMEDLLEGDSFYLISTKGVIMKGVVLSAPYHGYKGDSSELFADIYPEFAAHPDSENLLSLDEIKAAFPGIAEADGPLERKAAAALDSLFTEYRNRIIPISSDFSSAPLAISMHVRFPALSSKSPSIIEEVDYRRYLQSKPRITEGYQEYERGGVWHYRINIHNFRLLRSFFEIIRKLYGSSRLSITFGLWDEDYCVNDGLSADEAENYLEKEHRCIEENTLFNIQAKLLDGAPDEAVYIAPDKEMLVSTRDRDRMLDALSAIGIEMKADLLFMSQFITEESRSPEKAYSLVDRVADALPGTMYFGGDDEE